MDFQFDGVADGLTLKFPKVIDEHRRLCMTIRVCRRRRPRMGWRCWRSSLASNKARIHPAGQRAGFNYAGHAGLLSGHTYCQYGLHQARIPVGGGLCRIVPRSVAGGVPQEQVVHHGSRGRDLGRSLALGGHTLRPHSALKGLTPLEAAKRELQHAQNHSLS